MLLAVGGIARNLNERDTADASLRRAIAIYERLAPNHLLHSCCYSFLGWTACDAGDIREGHRCFLKALAIIRRANPASSATSIPQEEANVWMSIGWTSSGLEQRQEAFARAVAIREKVAPGTINLAESLDYLSGAERGLGNSALA